METRNGLKRFPRQLVSIWGTVLNGSQWLSNDDGERFKTVPMEPRNGLKRFPRQLVSIWGTVLNGSQWLSNDEGERFKTVPRDVLNGLGTVWNGSQGQLKVVPGTV
jgi:hypothetical protein